jgi:hypothetical protein
MRNGDLRAGLIEIIKDSWIFIVTMLVFLIAMGSCIAIFLE